MHYDVYRCLSSGTSQADGSRRDCLLYRSMGDIKMAGQKDLKIENWDRELDVTVADIMEGDPDATVQSALEWISTDPDGFFVDEFKTAAQGRLNEMRGNDKS